MFRSLKFAPTRVMVSLACWGALLSFNVLADTAFSGIGRSATPLEIAAWDIDVRPDFKGLPAGQGSVAQGMVVWESKCASCHGVFGESNQTFSPLVGGTTAQDIKSGHVQRLNDTGYPGRTTLMKASTLSTLWDYINRAMPWTEPKSLTPNEVYAVVAYLLNLGSIVPDDLVLSNTNMAEVQNLLPNRNGMTTDHGLWPGKGLGNGGKPDVKVTACMKNCDVGVAIQSSLPDFARNAHGNLAEQNRSVGAQHGVNTTVAPATSLAQSRELARSSPPTAPVLKTASTTAMALTKTYSCVACHGVATKIVGPSFREIGKKYEGRADAVSYLEGKIRAGGAGVWGDIPMPAQSLNSTEATAIAQWLMTGAPD